MCYMNQRGLLLLVRYIVYDSYTGQNCYQLERVQRRAGMVLLGLHATDTREHAASVKTVMNDLKWESLETRPNNQRVDRVLSYAI